MYKFPLSIGNFCQNFKNVVWNCHFNPMFNVFVELAAQLETGLLIIIFSCRPILLNYLQILPINP